MGSQTPVACRPGQTPSSLPGAPLLRTPRSLTPFLTPFQALSTCPAACHCPLEAPKCAPGVGLVQDSCGCCKVCAKQLNEDCSKTEPCDHTKGLECNFGASSTALKGICRGKRLAVWPLLKKIIVLEVQKFSNFETMYGDALLLVAWQKGT